jgi:Tfp pilus assembly protein PilO
MTSLLDRLNLRPQERRLVVVTGLVLFIVANVWWVWPHFGDWQRVQNQIQEARRTLDRYRAEVNQLNTYRRLLAQLEGDAPVVLPYEQAVQLMRTAQQQAVQHGVMVTRTLPASAYAGARTNAFFEEQSVTLSVNTGEKELVNFLVAVTSGNSMIRVRDLSLRPDPSQTKLVGDLTLTATYQKKTAPAPRTASAAPTTSAARPAPIGGPAASRSSNSIAATP